MRNYIDQITPVETPKRGKCIKIYVHTEYKTDYAFKKWTNKKNVKTVSNWSKT